MDDGRDAEVAALEARSGRTLAGAYAFGDSEALMDELLAFVGRGSKRATAGSLQELEAEDDPFPAAGQFWGLLDGRGRGRFVAETVHVHVGRLGAVDAAFAWDEGEYDRTRESWLDGHRRYFVRQGVADPDALETVFERFRIVWPVEDTPVRLTDGVRELRIDDRSWADDVLVGRYGDRVAPSADAGRAVATGEDPRTLPALIAERVGRRVGLLTFRPRPGGEADVVTIDVLEGADVTDDVVEELHRAVDALAAREGWSTVRWPDPRA